MARSRQNLRILADFILPPSSLILLCGTLWRAMARYGTVMACYGTLWHVMARYAERRFYYFFRCNHLRFPPPPRPKNEALTYPLTKGSDPFISGFQMQMQMGKTKNEKRRMKTVLFN